LDAATKEEQNITNGLFSELLLKDLGAKVSLVGVEQINEKDAYGIEVVLSKGSKYTVFFDAVTGLKVRYLKVMETPQGTLSQTIDYGDYREINGVKFPFVWNQSAGPQKIKMEVSEVLVNQTLAADTFKVE